MTLQSDCNLLAGWLADSKNDVKSQVWETTTVQGRQHTQHASENDNPKLCNPQRRQTWGVAPEKPSDIQSMSHNNGPQRQQVYSSIRMHVYTWIFCINFYVVRYGLIYLFAGTPGPSCDAPGRQGHSHALRLELRAGGRGYSEPAFADWLRGRLQRHGCGFWKVVGIFGT